MDILIREVRSGVQGISEFRDTEVNGQELTIGSAPDQLIQLLGAGIAPRHAVIRGSKDGLELQCRGKHELLVAGEPVRRASLAVGAHIEIGGHHLTLTEPPPGFDVAVEIRYSNAVTSSDFEGAFVTSLEQTWLGKRRPAWVLLSLVLLVGLAVPLLLLNMVEDRSSTLWRSLPNDTLWSTGPLLPAHALAIGDDCSSCHTEPFKRVQDEQCLTCHTTTHDHLTGAMAAALEYQPPRCATCHREHHSPAQPIITANRLCTDCHRAPEDFAGHAELRTVSGFSSDTHPSFNATLLRADIRPGGTGLRFDWRYHIESVATGEEQSNLKFPHDIHLDGAKVRTLNDNTALGCASCHTLTADREHFEPITMDRHCRDCHELKFDPSEPERELPHGQPVEVVLALEGHFMRKFGNPQRAAEPRPRRRVPNRDTERDICNEPAFDCAIAATADEAMNQFARRGCVTCHVVEDTESDELYTRFQVHPVRLVTDYFPTARFDHQSHLTQRDASGDAACLTCHPADVSTTSQDLLIPDIDNCIGCHDDNRRRGAARDQIVLNCVSCHDYHPPRLGLWGAGLDGIHAAH